MATKPNRIQSKQLYAYVGSTPTRRIQSLDWNSNFTTDSVYELGNAGIVEDSVSLVETGITLNSFEWGTTDLEAMLFGIYEQRNIGGNSVTNTVGTIYVSSLGAGGDWSSKVSADSWLQVIHQNANATTNNAEYVKVASITHVAGSFANKIGLVSANECSSVPSEGDIVSLVNDYTITENTVDADPAHLMLPHRYSADSTVMMHTIALPRCYVDSLTYNVDVGGASEQNYSLVGEEEKMFINDYREARSITGSFMSYSGTGTLKFRVPYKSDAYDSDVSLAVYADSNMIGSNATLISKTADQCTIEVDMDAGLGIDSNTQIVYYYNDDSYKGYKGITNLDSGIGKLTKGYVEVLFGTSDSGNDEEKLSRATSVNINIPLSRESIEELGTSRSVAKPLEGNIRNEITLGFSRNDLREYAKMIGSSDTFDAGTLKEILMTDLKSITNVIIIVKFYNSQTTHSTDTLLKTITFSSCSFIGSGSNTPISGSSSLELKYSSQSLNIVGSGIPPVYS